MMITILLICFVSIFINLGIMRGSKINIKEILLCSVLAFSVILVFITEIMSLFHLLNFKFIVISWIVIFFISIYSLFSRKEKLFNFITILLQNISNNFKGLTKYEKYLFFSVIIILVSAFIQGIVYPPNNWDSMAYHMARIPNWISHQSVEHYPTHIYRQIFQPPFSEFVIMHFNILNFGDYFSNSVQFFFLVFSLVAILLIVEQLGLSLKYKLIAVILAATIPEVILEASSTQNDINGAFFILSSFYFAVKSVKEVRLQNYLFLGLSAGLGVLTKGTSYIFLAPILVIFAVIVTIKLFKSKNFNYLMYSLLAAFIFISINSGHYIRNYNLNRNILGIDRFQTYSKDFNETMSPTLLLSNIIKNAGLHISPYPINQLAYKVAYKLHTIADIDIENPATNFMDSTFSIPNIPNHEDSASNPIHFLVILLSFIVIGNNILKREKGSVMILLYLTLILFQVILFCLIFKWMPWNTRLHTSLFLLSVPLICYALSLNRKYINIMYKVIPFILLYAFCIVLFNHTRPYITFSRPLQIGQVTSQISVFDSRYKKYFANRPDIYEEYNAICENISSVKSRNIGIIIGNDDWEYPLYSQFYGREYNPVHLTVSNISKFIYVKPVNIDCIISTTLNETKICINGEFYYNQNRNNKYIWLYE